MKIKRIAFFLYDLSGGGTGRVNLNLMNRLSQIGYKIDLLLVKKEGEFIDQVNNDIRIIDFQKKRALETIFLLSNYLRIEKPIILITVLPTINIIGIAGNIISGLKTLVIPVEHMPVTIDAKENPDIEPRVAYRLYPFLYLFVKKIITISEEAANDFKVRYPCLVNKVEVIYNPVVSHELIRKMQDKPIKWFEELDKPIIIAVGRLTRQKNFSILIKAFAIVKQEIDCCLVILGEGEERGFLERIIKEFDVMDDCYLPGFLENPYACMARSAVFVLSSIYETLPTVLIEALACGVPIVSTDCFGVKEILDYGKYGIILDHPTDEEMATSIKIALRSEINKESFRKRSMIFSESNAISKYVNLIEDTSQ